MALLNIIKKGDDTLRKVCRPVDKITPRILTLLDDMRDTLIDSEGVGLAAPQVGILRRIALVIDTNDNDKMYELINPEIIEREGEQEEMEGCLSVPGEWAVTHRPMKVTSALWTEKATPLQSAERALPQDASAMRSIISTASYSSTRRYTSSLRKRSPSSSTKSNNS